MEITYRERYLNYLIESGQRTILRNPKYQIKAEAFSIPKAHKHIQGLSRKACIYTYEKSVVYYGPARYFNDVLYCLYLDIDVFSLDIYKRARLNTD